MATSAAWIRSLLGWRERLVVRAPRAGYVLQVYVRRGEATPPGTVLPVVRLGHIGCEKTVTAAHAVRLTG